MFLPFFLFDDGVKSMLRGMGLNPTLASLDLSRGSFLSKFTRNKNVRNICFSYAKFKALETLF